MGDFLELPEPKCDRMDPRTPTPKTLQYKEKSCKYKHKHVLKIY